MRIFDRNGHEISMNEFITRYPFEGEIASDELPSGHKVFTTWLGIDQNYSGVGPPLIFQTTVLGPDGDRWDQFEQQYATIVEAAVGHGEVVMLVGMDQLVDTGERHRRWPR